MKKVAFLFALAAAFGCAHNQVDTTTNQTPSEFGERAPAMTDQKMDQLLNTAMFTAHKDIVSLNATQYSYQYDSTQVAPLENCRGSAKISRENGTLQMTVMSPQSCSNVFYDDPSTRTKRFVGHIAGGKGEEKIALPEAYGDNVFHVILTSNSGKTTADITVHSFVPRPVRKFTYEAADFTLSTYLFGRRWGQLADCGGSVSLDIDSNKQVYLYFSGMTNCSRFSILTDNGSATNFKDEVIGADSSGRGGKILIPREMYQIGANSIKFIVKSGTEKTYDIVRIEFPATW